jgi:hypothetical protein
VNRATSYVGSDLCAQIFLKSSELISDVLIAQGRQLRGEAFDQVGGRLVKVFSLYSALEDA